MLHFFVFVLLGALFGLLAGLLGTSGGIVAVPVLAVVFGMRQQVAQGTAFVMMLPNVITGAWGYIRHGDVDRKMGIALAAAAIPCSFAAALLATRMHSAALRTAFAIFVLLLGAFMAWRTFTKDGKNVRHTPWPYASVVGGLSGLLSGIFSGGAAAFAVATLSYWFALEQVAAQGMALIVELPATAVSLLTYGFAGDVAWAPGISLAVGGVFGVRVGTELAHKLPQKALRVLFIAYVTASAIMLLTHRDGK